MALVLEVFYYLKEKPKLKVNSHSQVTQVSNTLWDSPQVFGDQACSAIAASVGQP